MLTTIKMTVMSLTVPTMRLVLHNMFIDRTAKGAAVVLINKNTNTLSRTLVKML